LASQGPRDDHLEEGGGFVDRAEPDRERGEEIFAPEEVLDQAGHLRLSELAYEHVLIAARVRAPARTRPDD
jgi:hypothetical protein